MSFKTSIAAPDTATAIAFAMPSSSHPLTYIALTATMMPQANPRIHARYRFVRARRARRVLLPVIASCLRPLAFVDALFALVPVVVLVSPFIVETSLLYISRPDCRAAPVRLRSGDVSSTDCFCFARLTFHASIRSTPSSVRHGCQVRAIRPFWSVARIIAHEKKNLGCLASSKAPQGALESFKLRPAWRSARRNGPPGGQGAPRGSDRARYPSR